jgi:hypothetical protein
MRLTLPKSALGYKSVIQEYWNYGLGSPPVTLSLLCKHRQYFALLPTDDGIPLFSPVYETPGII